MQKNTEVISVLLAVLCSLLLPVLHILLIRLLKDKGKIKLMMVSFAAYAAIWTALSISIIGYHTVNQFIAGYFMIGFLCLGYAEAFSMLCRGFSLRIMMDIFSRGSLTLHEIIEGYGGGKGVDWMLKKRIETLKSMGLLGFDGEVLELMGKRAYIIGKTGLFLKRFLKMGTGG